MRQFSASDIEELQHIERINLINSCSGYKSANLIGTRSNQGLNNVAVFSSITHMGSNPPLLGFFLRPTTVPRNTYENIKETGIYTINHIHSGIIKDAHHTSAKYPRDISEFESTELEEEFRDGCYAPFVKHSPVQIQMQYVDEYFIKANDTILIIGEIKNLFVKETLLNPDGFIDLSKGNICTINGLDAYSTPSSNERLSYQRPKSHLIKDSKA